VCRVAPEPKLGGKHPREDALGGLGVSGAAFNDREVTREGEKGAEWRNGKRQRGDASPEWRGYGGRSTGVETREDAKNDWESGSLKSRALMNCVIQKVWSLTGGACVCALKRNLNIKRIGMEN
jgi:hypothetical protein